VDGALGAPWRDLPEEFGCWNSLYKRFARWERRGVWQLAFTELAEDSDFEEVFIDSTVIRVHQHAAGAPKDAGMQAIGRSRGGLTMKIHALVEALGNLARWCLTPGQADVSEAQPLLAGVAADAVAADKAYDSDALIDSTCASGAQAVIPPRANRTELSSFDRHIYKARNLVKRFFCRIKHFRRIATRYDKLDRRYQAFTAIAAAWIWLA
jgi:transposase